jgi:hypothetical protein
LSVICLFLSGQQLRKSNKIIVLGGRLLFGQIVNRDTILFKNWYVVVSTVVCFHYSLEFFPDIQAVFEGFMCYYEIWKVSIDGFGYTW